ncbi:DUF4291 domain-containing protein, partial [Frankia sp. Cj5]|uniref:DUF4291 domain-containing protein n=1 Tax=Frankia sp. Cj5 TaxID=2880978 RepID=UPI00351D5377
MQPGLMRQREVRALFNTDTITVYQAYSHEIADRALEAGIFVPPFKPGRMTWIKPSFLWMMHRSGWATKPNQERILAIEISREGFMWSLTHSCLSSYAANLFPSYETWRSQLTAAPVRIQWDPDRDLHMRPQSERSIQIGLGIEASRLYVNNWINRIRD